MSTPSEKVPTIEESEKFINRFNKDPKAWAQFYGMVSNIHHTKKQEAFDAIKLAATEHGVELDDADTAKQFMRDVAGVDLQEGTSNKMKVSFHLLRRLKEACPSGYKNDDTGQNWDLKSRLPDWLMEELQSAFTESGRLMESDLEALVSDYGCGPFVPRDKRPSEIKKKQSAGS